MHSGSWELEVYARDFRERRWREAAKQRQVDEAARSVPRRRVNAFDFRITHLLAAVAAWRSSARTRLSRRTDRAASRQPALVPERERPAPRALPSHLTQPYAGMMIVARGPMVEVVEDPCVVSDC